MTDEEWDTVALLLAKGWKGEFGPGEDRAYRLLLDRYSGEEVVAALRQLTARGHYAIPAVSEIVQTIEADPSRPIFEEVFELLYGSGRVLAARPREAMFDNYPAMMKAEDEAASDRAWEVHPLLGKFVDDYGVRRLKMLEVNHDDHAALVRRDLQEAWDRFVEANRNRDAAALAAGRRREIRRGGMRRVDPLAGIGDRSTGTGEGGEQ